MWMLDEERILELEVGMLYRFPVYGRSAYPRYVVLRRSPVWNNVFRAMSR